MFFSPLGQNEPNWNILKQVYGLFKTKLTHSLTKWWSLMFASCSLFLTFFFILWEKKDTEATVHGRRVVVESIRNWAYKNLGLVLTWFFHFLNCSSSEMLRLKEKLYICRIVSSLYPVVCFVCIWFLSPNNTAPSIQSKQVNSTWASSNHNSWWQRRHLH